MDILYAWIASLASTAIPLITKATSKTLVKNSWLFNILWVAFSIPFLLILALMKGGGIPTNWIYLLLLSGCYSLYYICITLAVYKLDVTVVSPLFSLRAVFAVLLGIIFLHERISPLGLMLITLIIAATPLSAYNEKLRLKSFLHKHVFVAIFAMLMLALVGFFSHTSVAINGYATTLLWQGPLALIFLLPTLKFIDFKHETFTRKSFTPFIALGISGFIYTITATTAYAHNLAISSIIVSLPLSMIFAYLLSKVNSHFFEKQSNKVYIIRFSGAFIMVGAGIWLSLIH